MPSSTSDTLPSSAANDTPFLIVGGGPVGLALAIELGMRGIPCTLVEQRDGIVRAPKASLVNTRSMEYCRRWGLTEQVIAASLPPESPHDVLFVVSLTGRELFRFKFPGYQQLPVFDYSPERNAICAQIWFDPILLERARALPSVTIRLRTRFETLTQDATGVTATVTDLDSGATDTIRAGYLIGCDGPDSKVRKVADIPIPAVPPLNCNMNILFRSPELPSLHPSDQGQLYRMIGPQGSWGNVTAVNGREMWRLTVHCKTMPDVEKFDSVGAVRRALGPTVPFEILSAAAWERRQVVADTYRVGRVLVAGDAAHQLSTTGGFGMNTGIGDAIDLAWMLAAIHDGWAGPDLLDCYEIERRPIGLRNVEEASGTFLRQAALPGGPLDDDTPEGDAARAAFVEAIEKLNIYRQFDVEGVALDYRYADSPIVVADGTPAPEPQFTRYVQNAHPGSRAPHAWLAPGKSTLDLFWETFTLIRFGGDRDGGRPLIEAARTRGVPLQVVDIDNPEIAALYERKFVLVRPDGHVAWRSDTCGEADATVIDRVRGALGLRKDASKAA